LGTWETTNLNLPLYNWAITSYAPNGDVLAMTDDVMGSWTCIYDSMNRLTSGTATAGADNGLTLDWTYDRYGNRWAQNATGTGNASAVQPQLTFYGNTNRIDGWSYSASGNLANDQIHSYPYDAENRIATLNGEPEYIYDAEGRRVAKTNSSGVATTIYVLGLGGEQVSELNGSGAWVHSNVFAGGGRLLASYEGPAGTDTAGYHYHLTDWLGTKRMQTTAAGNQEETCMSYPFGDGLSCTGGPDATEHHFTGKERDTESGLDYFEARYLTSDLGRFMTPDWAAKPTAVPYALFGNPQSLNLYAYVVNNPNTGIDLDGHVSENRGGGDEVDGWSFESELEHPNGWDSITGQSIPDDGPGSGSGQNSGSGSNSGSAGTSTTPPKPANPPVKDPTPQPQGTDPANTTSTPTTTTTTTTPTTNGTPTTGTTTAPAPQSPAPNNAPPPAPQQTPQQPKKQPWYCGTGNSWSHPFTAPTSRQWGKWAVADGAVAAYVGKFTGGKDPISEAFLASSFLEGWGWAACD